MVLSPSPPTVSVIGSLPLTSARLVVPLSAPKVIASAPKLNVLGGARVTRLPASALGLETTMFIPSKEIAWLQTLVPPRTTEPPPVSESGPPSAADATFSVSVAVEGILISAPFGPAKRGPLRVALPGSTSRVLSRYTAPLAAPIEAPLATVTVPPLALNPPVWVLAPVSSSVPGPAFRMDPVPLMFWLMVKVTAALATSIPPSKLLQLTVCALRLVTDVPV